MTAFSRKTESPHDKMARLRAVLGHIPSAKEWLMDAGFDEATGQNAQEALAYAARQLKAQLDATK